MRTSTWLEIASLSKTFAAVFAVRYFRERGIALTTRVNVLLAAGGSPFRLKAAPGNPKRWGDDVLLRHLLDHTGLGMHYVNGVPLRSPLPPVLDLIRGKHTDDLGYEAILVEKEPGKRFGYSGGGFLVLQHLLECWEGRPIDVIMDAFLRKLGIADELSFAHRALPGVHYATGHRDDLSEVEDGRLMFPPLAAGALGTPRALLRFLRRLSNDYASNFVDAREILRAEDKGSFEFMGASMGLGVFVASAGPNKFAIHQAANDGFRGVYLYCFDGPNADTGFVLLNNGDNRGTNLNCAMCRLLIERMGFRGVDFSRVNEHFEQEGLKQEEIVNLGLKSLVFDAFLPAEARARL